MFHVMLSFSAPTEHSKPLLAYLPCRLESNHRPPRLAVDFALPGLDWFQICSDVHLGQCYWPLYWVHPFNCMLLEIFKQKEDIGMHSDDLLEEPGGDEYNLLKEE